MNADVEVHFRSLPSGHGHYKIFCEATFEDQKKEFVKTTDDMPWIDSLHEFKHENNPSWEEETDFYLEKFGDYFEMECINEWIEELKWK